MVGFNTPSRDSATIGIAQLPVGRARGLAALALIAANMIWAGSAAASKAALPDVPPLTMASLRVAIALAVLHLLLAARRERPVTGPGPALLGLTGVALFCACQNLGLLFADATTTALISGAIPVLTAAIAVPMLRERLDTSRLAGLLVSLAGGFLIVLLGAGPVGGATAASLLPLASAVSFALYAALGRRVFCSGSALAVVAGSTRYGLLFLIPATALELAVDGPGMITPQSAALLLYLGAGCSALAFVLCGYGLSRLEAGHCAVYGNLKPLVGVVLAMALLGEPMTAPLAIGGTMIPAWGCNREPEPPAADAATRQLTGPGRAS